MSTEASMRNIGKQGKNGMSKGQAKAERNDVDDDVDGLFRLPLAEFTGARNALAARLKKSGRGDDAALVKALGKPSISAWAVNQLYWDHREAFDELIASGERFHKAQTSGKVANMRDAIDARRELLAHLSDLATSLLQGAGPNPGHNPAPDTIRRVTATLEALSAFASRSGAPRPGRLSDDVDPPGFELFGSAIPSAGIEAGGRAGGGRQEVAETPSRTTGSRKSSSAASKRNDDALQLAEARKAKLAAAKLSLQDAKKSLSEARANAQSLEAAQKRADTEAKKAEKQRSDAEESLQKAKAAAEAAARRARSVAVEVKEAASEVDDAELTVKEASRELEKLFGES